VVAATLRHGGGWKRRGVVMVLSGTKLKRKSRLNVER
jgi:hypothetical protein